MARYRQKPMVVEATQVSKDNPKPYEREGALYKGDISYANAKLEWLEIDLPVREGDYVISRQDGSFYCMDKEDFEVYYEPEG